MKVRPMDFRGDISYGNLVHNGTAYLYAHMPHHGTALARAPADAIEDRSR